MDEKKRRYQVNFRLTEDEAITVEAKAQKVGLSISAYAKKQALHGKIQAIGITREEVREVLAELGRLGNNLNQIAKVANQGGGVDVAQLDAINKAMDDLWKYIRTGKKPRKPSGKDEQPEKDSPSSTSTTAEEKHVCKKCGAILNVVQSKKPERNGQWYRICPHYSNEDRGHTFEWVEQEK